MNKTISIQIPSEKIYIKPTQDFIKDICINFGVEEGNIEDILTSVKELIENSIVHAYKNKVGKIEVSIYPFETGIRVDVHDWGTPMSYKTYSAVPIDSDLTHGFNKIFHLVDIFEYNNLGKNGKVFTIIKYSSIPVSLKQDEKEANNIEIPKDININIENFESGDEEGIARLIYKNYGYSYIKDIFYYPTKIAKYHGKKFYSVVAKDKDKIIGHFAFIKLPNSNIAEIGVVVVDPLYKGRGIMNAMMEKLLEKAKEIGLDAVFGEAIMYHIFSQKTNLKYGFVESALMLGKTPADIRIENNKLTKIGKRGSVLIGYKFFTKRDKKLYIPQVYEKMIEKTYKNSNITYTKLKKTKSEAPAHVFFHYNFDPLANVATIIIDKYGRDFKKKLRLLVYQLKVKHVDMIYLYISLKTIDRIDKVVKIANQLRFFYSGIAFLYQEDRDYLLLQLKNSNNVGSKNLVCYSEFCKKLYKYIQKDEMRVNS